MIATASSGCSSKPAISGQAGETLLRLHAQRIAQGVDAVGKIVGRSHDVIAAMLLEQLGDPGAAATAADDAQIDLGIGGGAESQTGIDQRYRSRRRSRAGHETASRNISGSIGWGRGAVLLRHGENSLIGDFGISLRQPLQDNGEVWPYNSRRLGMGLNPTRPGSATPWPRHQ